MYDTARNYIPFIDMCFYCELDTGGQHKLNCSLLQLPTPQMVPEMKVNITVNYGEAKDGK